MSSNKRQFTIDTCVLTQVNQGSKKQSLVAMQFLRRIYDNCHAIVFDKYQNRILKEYKSQAKGFSKEWLIAVLKREKKTFKVDIRNVNISVKMKNDRFDHKFINASYKSSDKLLVTRDRGFFGPRLRFLIKKNGVTLLEIDEAMKLL
jgi:predicted nucleic acid-binding protein